jgi:hypothetical protein
MTVFRKTEAEIRRRASDFDDRAVESPSIRLLRGLTGEQPGRMVARRTHRCRGAEEMCGFAVRLAIRYCLLEKPEVS